MFPPNVWESVEKVVGVHVSLRMLVVGLGLRAKQLSWLLLEAGSQLGVGAKQK